MKLFLHSHFVHKIPYAVVSFMKLFVRSRFVQELFLLRRFIVHEGQKLVGAEYLVVDEVLEVFRGYRQQGVQTIP